MQGRGLAPGERLGPYEITGFIAAGGMGEVYRARDTRLGRPVAIKRLTTQDDRFVKEAHAIAALNHPHICQIYDVGAGYLVLEYIDGQPLAGPLPLSDALRVAIQIAGALEVAHGQGILHRDLKPANVLLTTSGDVKLLDFGLAKRDAGEADATRTAPGTVLGTAAYMSPEQAEGKPLDGRSDIFSFGAVLFELFSGRRAFPGDTVMQVLVSVLRDEPPPLGIAPDVDRIVSQCLAKSRDERPATVTIVRRALEAAVAARSPGAAPVSRASIVVLPFANLNTSADSQYFSDGLTEEIITTLGQVPGLKVTARTSAFSFRGKEQDVRTIAGILGVRHVLEGSVRCAGNRLRVAAQLVSADDGCQLWSERYDREMADVFAIQDEIAQSIAAALRVTLQVDPSARRHTPPLPAYEHYLRARHQQWTLAPDATRLSRQLYEQALRLDPGFAAARVGLAHYHLWQAAFDSVPPAEAMPKVREEAQRALEIDPALPQAHAMLGIVSGIFDYDWGAAGARFQQATAVDPVPPEVRVWHGVFYLQPIGRASDAIAEHRLALEADPLNVTFCNGLTEALMADDRWDEAEVWARRMLELAPDYFVGHYYYGYTCLVRGDISEFIASARRGAEAAARWGWTEAAGQRLVATREYLEFAEALEANGGDTARAEADLANRVGGRPAHWRAYAIAHLHMMCGNGERAADLMELAIEERHMMAPRLLGWKRWRANPRWPALARMINLPGS
jgi:serine/threonine-protein kinase